MKILVTGDRFWEDPRPIWATLTGLYCLDSTNWISPKFEPFVVIEGGQKQYERDTGQTTGADYWAAQWCHSPQTRYLHGPVLTPEEWKNRTSRPAVNEPTFYSDSSSLLSHLFSQPVVHYQYPADWNQYGKTAGPIRNSLMLAQHPDIDLVLAFHDDLEGSSKGTLDMVRKAQKGGIEVWVYARRLPPIKLL